MKYEAELMVELENIKADMSLLMDCSADSPEVKEWIGRVLTIKAELANAPLVNIN
ncbi:hypothetical protein [Shewanella frigidimarina]|uniref:hypothetical protein n=1 Tax=Shewanella frigidimarina TaxID=56812 RepID=UPI001404FA2C|nr:hypothetical protein [Shewanella frigidimarina]